MSLNLRNRSLLTVQDFTQREFFYLLDLARDLKRAKYARTEQEHLKGKEIVLIFEKSSTRTRCAFEVACFDQGAHVTYLDPAGSQIGHKESVKDTARVLGRMYDAIEFRGYSQEAVFQNDIVAPNTAFLPKPFTIRQLTERVREVLDS